MREAADGKLEALRDAGIIVDSFDQVSSRPLYAHRDLVIVIRGDTAFVKVTASPVWADLMESIWSKPRADVVVGGDRFAKRRVDVQHRWKPTRQQLDQVGGRHHEAREAPHPGRVVSYRRERGGGDSESKVEFANVVIGRCTSRCERRNGRREPEVVEDLGGEVGVGEECTGKVEGQPVVDPHRLRAADVKNRTVLRGGSMRPSRPRGPTTPSAMWRDAGQRKRSPSRPTTTVARSDRLLSKILDDRGPRRCRPVGERQHPHDRSQGHPLRWYMSPRCITPRQRQRMR
jgi:hypothetical protein